MGIDKIDKNLGKVSFDDSDCVWFDAKEDVFSLSGICFDENKNRYCRILDFDAEKVSENVRYLATNTAGGRIRFVTDSPFVCIKVVEPNFGVLPHMSIVGQFGFSILKNNQFLGIYFPTLVELLSNSKDCLVPSWSISTSGKTDFAYSGKVNTYSDSLNDYSLLFPLYDNVVSLKIGIKKGSKILKSKPRVNEDKPIVFYGSSVTHGCAASRPGMDYSNIISTKLNVNITNLGFSGNCKGEQTMATYIASLPLSMLVMGYDYNANTVDDLKNTHLSFYKKFRENKVDVPIIFLTAPTGRNIDKDRAKDYELRREVINQTYQYALEHGDKNVYFLSGEELIKEDENYSMTVDGVHPTDAGFINMANTLILLIKQILKL